MPVLDLPQEILDMVIRKSILARASLDPSSPNVGIARGLRLRLVCKTFSQSVQQNLFKTGLLDAFAIRQHSRAGGYTLFGDDFDYRKFHGADRFWLQYTVWRAKRANKDKSKSSSAYQRIHDVATYISQAEEARNSDNHFDGFEAILEKTCRVALPFMGRFAGTWPKRPHCEVPLDVDVMSVAAYHGMTLLMGTLLARGTEQAGLRHIFPTLCEAAARGNQVEALELLLGHPPRRAERWWEHDPYSPDEFDEDFDDDFDEESDKVPFIADENMLITSIFGAVKLGSISLVKDIAARPFFAAMTTRLINRNDSPTHHPFKFPHSDNALLALLRTPSVDVFRYSYATFWAERPDLPELVARWLCRACNAGLLEIVRYLVDDLGAAVDGWQHRLSRSYESLGYGNVQPLRLAARSSHLDVVKFLLERGANPDRVSGAEGWSPLAAAAAAGSLTIGTMLLDGGATGDVSVWMNAALREHTGILELLQRRGHATPYRRAHALDQAGKHGLDSMTQLLSSWGASREHLEIAPPCDISTLLNDPEMLRRKVEAMKDEFIIMRHLGAYKHCLPRRVEFLGVADGRCLISAPLIQRFYASIKCFV